MGDEKTPVLPVPKPEKPTHALHAGMLVAILSAVLFGTGVLIYFILNEPNSASPAVSTHETVTQSTGDQKPATYTVAKIPDIAIPFHITSFPEATFTLLSITRIDGLKAGGCDADQPKEISKLVKLGNSCFNPLVFDPHTSYSLIGIRLRVANTGKTLVQGDLFELVYLPDPNSIVLAQKDIDFVSYTIGYGEDRIVDLSFWLPSSKTTAYLAYAPQKNPAASPPFNLPPLKNFQNAIKLDFQDLRATLGANAQ